MDLDFPLWPLQEAALTTPAQEVLFGGAAGPGKSHLMRVACILWAFGVPGLQIYLFRRHARDLRQGHLEGPTGFRALLTEAERGGFCEVVEHEIRVFHGDGPMSRISLNHCQYDQDVFNYKTIEFHVLALEEASELTEFQIRYLRSRVRMPDAVRVPPDLAGRFPRCLYTSNPGGPGHSYLKRAFIDSALPGAIWTAPDDDGGFSRQFIPARLIDNPSINPTEYRKRLTGLGSKAYVDALLNGDWNAIVGAFFDVFDLFKHRIESFAPAAHLTKFRGFDWGSSAPFGVLWFCVADGEPWLSHRGTKCWAPRGSIIAYREWYGCNPDRPSEGIGISNLEIINGIKSRTPDTERIVATITDSLPFQSRDGKGDVSKTIAKVFADNGVPLQQGNTDRVEGWSMTRSALIGKDGVPELYFTEDCHHAIRTIPLMQRSLTNCEDIADHQEDHLPDIIRLACISSPQTKDKPPDPIECISNVVTFDQAMKHHKRQQAKTRSQGF